MHAAAPAWAAAAAGKVTIERIEVFPVRFTMVSRFKFFEGPEGSPTGRPSVMVKVTASDGTVGWGESVPIPKWTYETIETVTSTIRRYLAPVLLGHDPVDILGAHEQMNRIIAPGFTTGQPLCKAGIDIALHDLVGKLLNSSLAALWKRSPGKPLPLSWTLNPKTMDELDPLIDAGLARGYRHFNLKVPVAPGFGATEYDMARHVKQRVPETFLWADANGGYTPQAALEAAPKLADAGVDVLEAPLRPNQLTGYRDLKRQGALPVLMDEGVIAPNDLVEFIRLEMLDGVAMKPARCGGLVSCRKQIELIEDAGLMWLGSGLTDPDISLAATLALYGAFGYSKPAALNGPQFLAESVITNRLMPRDGQLAIPAGPGLGIEVDETKLQEMVAQEKQHQAEAYSTHD